MLNINKIIMKNKNYIDTVATEYVFFYIFNI